jgi:hypothetical protein
MVDAPVGAEGLFVSSIPGSRSDAKSVMQSYTEAVSAMWPGKVGAGIDDDDCVIEIALLADDGPRGLLAGGVCVGVDEEIYLVTVEFRSDDPQIRANGFAGPIHHVASGLLDAAESCDGPEATAMFGRFVGWLRPSHYFPELRP